MRHPVDALALQAALRTALLTSATPWSAVDVLASVDSTNAEALRGPQAWRVVVADHQSAGRGRLSRTWDAPPGAALAVTCVLPVGAPGADAGWLPLLTGLAMRRALVHCGGGRLRAELKWPNDVLAAPAGAPAGSVRGGAAGAARLRKICGILCQAVPATAATAARAGLVVVGAGVNIDQVRAELPVDTATSLRLCGVRDVRLEELLEDYLGALLELYSAWQAGGAALEGVRAAYRSACVTVGQAVDVHRPGGATVRGRASGVDDQGRLLVTGPEATVAHAAGDVVHVREAQHRCSR